MSRLRVTKTDLDRFAGSNGIAPNRSKESATKAKRPRKLGPSETEVSKAIGEYLQMIGCFCIRTQAGAVPVQRGKGVNWMHFAPKGTADRIGHLPCGRFLAVEVKRPGQRPTQAQIDWLIDRNNAGGVAFWCNSLTTCERIMTHVLKGRRVEVRHDGEVWMI